MSNWFKRFSLMSLLLITVSMAALAQRGRLEFLGDAHVDGAVDHDNIVVTGSRGTFRAIQLKVSDNTVDFQRVVIHYGNGTSQPIPIRSKIRPGQSTRLIDLPGDRRVIESVELWYARANWGPRRPKVELFGLK